MAKNSKPGALFARLSRLPERFGKDPRVFVRVALGVLLLANLVAAFFVFRPWGGSPEDLQRRLSQLRAGLRQREETVRRFRALVETVEKTHGEAGRFMARHFLDDRAAYSTVLTELSELAQRKSVV